MHWQQQYSVAQISNTLQHNNWWNNISTDETVKAISTWLRTCLQWLVIHVGWISCWSLGGKGYGCLYSYRRDSVCCISGRMYSVKLFEVESHIPLKCLCTWQTAHMTNCISTGYDSTATEPTIQPIKLCRPLISGRLNSSTQFCGLFNVMMDHKCKQTTT